jgi:uncharacterized protein (DUF1015 family)
VVTLPEIRPFPGILYDLPGVDLRRVLAPPYDVISPALQADLLARDERNVVRIVLNPTPGEAGYAEAGATFSRFRAAGVLRDEPTPALYLLEQTFTAYGRTLRRFGILARLRAEPPEAGTILPHEHTRPAAKEDRFRLLRATRANFSPVFLMFRDPRARFGEAALGVMTDPPTAVYADDGGVGHRLWRITDPAAIACFTALVAASVAYIADGHHRFATALRHAGEVGPDGAWTFAYLTPMEAPGLLVLPYHRLLSQGPSLAEARERLGARFRLVEAGGVTETAQRVAASKAPFAFGLAQPGGGAVVAESKVDLSQEMLPADSPACLRVLDTYVLHKAVLPQLLAVDDSAVAYAHSLADVEEAVAGGGCCLAVLMRPTPVDQIVGVAEASEAMPPKSTFFHPKIPSGLVIHPLLA